MSGPTQSGVHRLDEEMGWAVWVGTSRDNRCVAVLAKSQEEAEEKALDESEEDEIWHVDGPFQNSKPGAWEFEFVTEHRERVVVEAPTKDYAAESAAAVREYRGEYVQTVHTESRKIHTKEVPN